MEVTVPGGDSVTLEVQALSDDLTLLGFFTITRDTYASIVPELLDIQVFGTVDEGADLDAVLVEVDDGHLGDARDGGARPRRLRRRPRQPRSPRS